MNENLKQKERKTTALQAFSPVYSGDTGALLYCLAPKLEADRPFKAAELSVISRKAQGNTGRLVRARPLQGRNQLEHPVFTANTQHIHSHTYTHVR